MILQRKVTTEVKGRKITYIENYMLNDEGKEIYNRRIAIQNDKRLYDIFKKREGLLTSLEVKKIREKYGFTQDKFSKELGLGEIQINRIETGSIQNKSTDNLIRWYDKLRENNIEVVE